MASQHGANAEMIMQLELKHAVARLQYESPHADLERAFYPAFGRRGDTICIPKVSDWDVQLKPSTTAAAVRDAKAHEVRIQTPLKIDDIVAMPDADFIPMAVYIKTHDFLSIIPEHAKVSTQYRIEYAAIHVAVGYSEPYMGHLMLDQLMEPEAVEDTTIRSYTMDGMVQKLIVKRGEMFAELLAQIDIEVEKRS